MTAQTFSTLKTQAAEQFAAVNWPKHQRRAQNILVAVGVCLYLAFLAVKAAVNAGKTARALWIKYEITAKLQSAFEAIKSEIAAQPALSSRVAEVRAFYVSTAAKALSTAAAMRSDFDAIKGQ